MTTRLIDWLVVISLGAGFGAGFGIAAVVTMALLKALGL